MKLASKDILTDSIVDGEGLRAVIWTQGCKHHCKGCHNPNTWSFDKGYDVDIEEVKEKLKTLTFQDGITLSGGDPFFQIKEVTEVAKYAKELGLNVWAYTGFLYENLVKDKEALNLLKYIDVLIDGPFMIEKRNLSLMYRGSSNQRIINVPKSLKEKRVVEIKKYDRKKVSI